MAILLAELGHRFDFAVYFLLGAAAASFIWALLRAGSSKPVPTPPRSTTFEGNTDCPWYPCQDVVNHGGYFCHGCHPKDPEEVDS